MFVTCLRLGPFHYIIIESCNCRTNRDVEQCDQMRLSVLFMYFVAAWSE